MTLVLDDYCTIDGVEYQVTDIRGDEYILQDATSGSYYYVRFFRKADLEILHADGRLRYGKKSNKTEEGSGVCGWHRWKSYVGLRERYEFCEKCNEKRHTDWKLIKDEKDS